MGSQTGIHCHGNARYATEIHEVEEWKNASENVAVTSTQQHEQIRFRRQFLVLASLACIGSRLSGSPGSGGFIICDL